MKVSQFIVSNTPPTNVNAITLLRSVAVNDCSRLKFFLKAVFLKPAIIMMRTNKEKSILK